MRRQLPSATVTFLFTDVEGSTRLLHELGAEDYAEALAEHRRILREAFSAYGASSLIGRGTRSSSLSLALPVRSTRRSTSHTRERAHQRVWPVRARNVSQFRLFATFGQAHFLLGTVRRVRTVILLRHGKSSWSDPTLADRDRPLAPRGERASRRIAKYVRRKKIPPRARPLLPVALHSPDARGDRVFARQGLPGRARARALCRLGRATAPAAPGSSRVGGFGDVDRAQPGPPRARARTCVTGC